LRGVLTDAGLTARCRQLIDDHAHVAFLLKVPTSRDRPGALPDGRGSLTRSLTPPGVAAPRPSLPPADGPPFARSCSAAAPTAGRGRPRARTGGGRPPGDRGPPSVLPLRPARTGSPCRRVGSPRPNRRHRTPRRAAPGPSP